MGKALCHDCDAEEGQLHQLGCDMEICPICLGQLISCDCWGRNKYNPTEIDRIPYVQQPIMCNLCGVLWPNLFMDKNWEKHVPPDMQYSIVYRVL